MKAIKNRGVIYSGIIIGLNLLLFGLTCTNVTPDKNIDITKSIIAAWVHTDSFVDRVYTYNIEGVSDSIATLIGAYNSDSLNVGMCIAATIYNFNNTDQEYRTNCTTGTTLTQLTSNAKDLELVTGQFQLKVGAKSLGKIEYFIATKSIVPFYERIQNKKGFISLNLVINILSISLIYMLYRAELKKANVKVEQDITAAQKMFNSKIYEKEKNYEIAVTELKSKYQNDLINKEFELEKALEECQAKTTDEARLNILKKISNGNKKIFPINDEVIYISYSHPDAKIYSKSKDERSFRSSLSDIMTAFHVDFIHLNRKVMLNKAYIGNRNYVTLIESGKKLKVILKSKTGEEEVEVTNACRDAFIQLLANNNNLVEDKAAS